ncbi:ABC transporter ATP-binding protein [Flavobacterium sp. LB2P84]|uniref:ABC transporter ATP-binding protein n=1 Tax=Flavobacterium yafengii TaxID=3041253 RepID=A0AAW6TNP8_9FLAO|nr:ABC transporter ATP-binding protein [Flavobacterium yafengii]MDI5898335.1 ABC transporter ATP-binding protein [Flavobacterium yafengii]MDI5951206.1 ABC transporter ATP-binding protein [Flavobacterium yafengii]MDI6034630.1 ABC transporter ATP-binding protein [Flavobacterium yafengii]
MDSNFKKIIPFTNPYRSHVVWNVIFNVFYALFSTLSFIALIPMMDVLFGTTEKINQKPVLESIFDIIKFSKEYLYYNITLLTERNGPEFALLLVIAIVSITFLFKNLFNYLASNHLMHLKNGVLKDLRNSMYHKIINLPVSYYSEKRKGDIMARMLGDVNEVQNSFFSILELIVKEPMTIVFTLVGMIAISFKLTLFVFIFIPLSGLLISKIGKSLRSKSERVQYENGYLISIVEESLSGLKVVKSYNAESNFKQKFNDSVTRVLKLSNSIGKKNNLATPLSEFLGIITICILLWFGGKMVLVDKLPDGKALLDGAKFLAYMGLAYNILTPAKAISKASYSVKNGLAAAQRVFEVLEVKNEITDSENAIKKLTFEDSIAIKNINFRYEDENVLKDFSLQVKKGQTVALVGQSGSGKSTIANLLTRFYDVNEGTIAIDGIDIKDMNLHSLRDLMGLVTQDSILFNDTIKANIALGKQDATDTEIIEALKIANAYEFVKDLPLGIHTNIGDSGNKLSGGQKQRLSIARAVLKNPPIMILDEATSALDTESEKFVQVALENMMQNRTSIVIAHRLSTIQKADLIVVMQKGKIVEQGKHDELIAMNGTYNKLVTMQSFE